MLLGLQQCNCSEKFDVYLEEEVQGETIGTMKEATVKNKIGRIKFKSLMGVGGGGEADHQIDEQGGARAELACVLRKLQKRCAHN